MCGGVRIALTPRALPKCGRAECVSLLPAIITIKSAHMPKQTVSPKNTSVTRSPATPLAFAVLIFIFFATRLAEELLSFGPRFQKRVFIKWDKHLVPAQQRRSPRVVVSSQRPGTSIGVRCCLEAVALHARPIRKGNSRATTDFWPASWQRGFCGGGSLDFTLLRLAPGIFWVLHRTNQIAQDAAIGRLLVGPGSSCGNDPIQISGVNHPLPT